MKHFINLTNGIQAIEDYGLTDYRFIRLQSTACEQKRWDNILLTISDEFLLMAALGQHCVVYDYGANKEIPRAIWQGLEWVKFTLNARWHETEYQPIGRAATGKKYFQEQYYNIDKRTKSRLDYFAKYLNGGLNITSVTSATDKDGKSGWYSETIKKVLLNRKKEATNGMV